ncbi:hypothetical protein [Niabella soli]|uniref:Uncharacterized protein n=1 Tax=Niabella soli DSM 19437 TaxID=929713 RepID=W0F7F1_9BACT|nr:hypothetical protein [Niabella soli]AHF17276.1 hypothetical protein NIASO_05075 [Niabella soli DSM 19437]
MKRLLSFVSALLVLTGLKAQTTDVKKETTPPKPVAGVVSSTTTKPVKLTTPKNVKAPEYKYDNNKPAQFKKDNNAPKAVSTKAIKAG